MSSSVRRVTTGLELVAIDLDGTLVDSIRELYEAVVRMQATLSREPATLSQVQVWVGNGIERLVHRALTGSLSVEADANLFNEALPLFKKHYRDVIGQYSRLYPGVLEGLNWLAEQHVPIVMVTNKDSEFANHLLKQLEIDHFFAHRIGGDDVPAKKPAPDALWLAANLCTASPECSVLVGDSVSDFQAARAAGFRSVGVSYGYNHGMPVRTLEPALAPEIIIDSFFELSEVLKRGGDVSS